MSRSALGVLAVALTLSVIATHGVVIITGDSMRPAFVRGDVLVYRKTPEVRAGEVAVFFRDSGARVAHRVVARGDRGEVRTRGDANPAADPFGTPAERVCGRMILRIPFGALARSGSDVLCYTSQSIVQ